MLLWQSTGVAGLARVHNPREVRIVTCILIFLKQSHSHESIQAETNNHIFSFKVEGQLVCLRASPIPQVLINLYTQTLASLSQLPKDAAYRQATEALTQSRLTIAQQVV